MIEILHGLMYIGETWFLGFGYIRPCRIHIIDSNKTLRRIGLLQPLPSNSRIYGIAKGIKQLQ